MQTFKEGGALSLLSWLPVLWDLPGRPITEAACSDASKLSNERRRRVCSRIVEMAISGNVAWPRVNSPSIVVSSSWSPGAGWWTQ
jgi:hypothetical protein